MLITPAATIRSSEITDKRLYVNRRTFMRSVAGAAAGAALAGEGLVQASEATPHGRKLASIQASAYSTDERSNTWEQVTSYNNYYEFGTDKEQPARLARTLVTEPWTVTVDGECHKPAVYHLEDVLKGRTLEDRVYRHRCVEAWSMVIPWVGFPLADLYSGMDLRKKF